MSASIFDLMSTWERNPKLPPEMQVRAFRTSYGIEGWGCEDGTTMHFCETWAERPGLPRLMKMVARARDLYPVVLFEIPVGHDFITFLRIAGFVACTIKRPYKTTPPFPQWVEGMVYVATQAEGVREAYRAKLHKRFRKTAVALSNLNKIHRA